MTDKAKVIDLLPRGYHGKYLAAAESLIALSDLLRTHRLTDEASIVDGLRDNLSDLDEDLTTAILEELAEEGIEKAEEAGVPFFRDLEPDEESEFRKWARENYQPGEEIKSVWHPLVRAECDKINEEADAGPRVKIVQFSEVQNHPTKSLSPSDYLDKEDE